MIVPYELIIIAAAVLPCAVFILLFDRFDRFKKEPRRLLLLLFSASMLSPPAAAVLEHLLFPLCAVIAPHKTVPVQAFMGIALPEEGMKLLIMFWITGRRKEFDELMDGPLYAVTTAMAFALVENIMYVLGAQQPMPLALTRGLTAVPLHALAGGFLGLGAAAYRVEGKYFGLWGGLLAAILIHGAYDWFLMDMRISGNLIFPLLIIGWFILVRRLKKARRKDILAGRHAPPVRPYSPFNDM